MPPKKRASKATTGAGTAKKRKTASRPKPTLPQVDVDERFQDSNNVHVLIEDSDSIWDASLNQSNVSDNNNKFYMLQLLVEGKSKAFYVHARWGRVGESGQIKSVKFDTLDEAKEEYCKRFKSKTGLGWDERTADPKPNKYTFLERAYEDDEDSSDDDDDADQKADDAKSELDIAIQRLVELIFNQNHFNSVLEEIGYNRNKLPLGKLGKTTLKTGFEQLRELASLIKHPSLARNKYQRSREEVIEEWTNKYYSTIPHVFGRNRPPMINHDSILRKEVAMLDTLTDMEVASAIMKTNYKAKDAASVSLLDQRFKELKLKEITVLDHKSSEYKDLTKYLIDSANDGNALRYRVQDIFRIERPGEEARFNKAATKVKKSNRLLLWHGSRTTNFAGILSQGLRIAPPEAPVSGYSFGKGVYLADCSSLSACFCIPGLSGGVGLLLLVEAELGNPIYEITTADYDAEAKAKAKNAIATKGVGSTGPLKWKDAGCIHEALEGVLMPDGKPGKHPNHKGGYMINSEYISYNVAHLRLRYLFKIAM